jgi:hypothetical protein
MVGYKNLALFVTLLSISGCEGKQLEEQAKRFQDCVAVAESKYKIAMDRLFEVNDPDEDGRCYFNVAEQEMLMRSKDNEVTACATMFAPKK